jgi:hypothetical protein
MINLRSPGIRSTVVTLAVAAFRQRGLQRRRRCRTDDQLRIPGHWNGIGHDGLVLRGVLTRGEVVIRVAPIG